MRRLAVILLCGALVLVGCRPNKAAPIPPTTTTLLPATTSPTAAPTTTLNLSAPPTPAQLQDPAYWNAILAALNRVAGDAFRSAVSTSAVEPKAREALRQVYGPALFEDEQKVLVDVASGKRNGLLVPPGDRVATVIRVVKVRADCVAIEASIDFSMVNPTVPTAPNAMRLVPRAAAGSSANPIPWAIDQFFIIAGPEDSSDLCSG